MGNPLISFVIPVYNREELVQEAVKSIIESGFLDCEIILVNDASTDNTGAICCELRAKHKNIKTLHNLKNMGPGPSRNEGLKLSSGKYVYFLDSDDEIKKETLNDIVEILRREDIDILTMNYKTVTPDGEQVIQNYKIEARYNGNDLLKIKPSVLYTEMWRHIFKAQMIRERRIEAPDATIGEDTCFTCLSFLQAKSIYVYPQVFCIHRVNEEAPIKEEWQWKKNIECLEKCVDILNRFIRKNRLKKESLFAVDCYIYSCITPLLKSIPAENLISTKETPRDSKIDLSLYRKLGIYGCARAAWTMILYKAKEANQSGKEIYLCPRGKVPIALAEKLDTCGIKIAGFLDTKCAKDLCGEANQTSETVCSFDKIEQYIKEGRLFMIFVLGSANRAIKISNQLKEMGLEKGVQYISFVG